MSTMASYCFKVHPCTLMAFSGQTATQAPQPIHRAGLTRARWTSRPFTSCATIHRAPSARQAATQAPVPVHRLRSTSATKGSNSTKPRVRVAAALTAAAPAAAQVSPTSKGAWQVPANMMPATDTSTGRSLGCTSWRNRSAPTGDAAAEVIRELAGAVLAHPAITVYACAQVEGFDGYIGNFKLKIVRQPPEGAAEADRLARVSRSGKGLGEFVPFVGVMPGAIPAGREEFDLDAGIIVLATGFRPYQPREGEYGFGEFPEVVTLPELIRLVAEAKAGNDTLVLNGRPIRNLAMIHCVGSRQIPGIHEENEGGYLNEYCSRTCCSVTLYAANLIRKTYPQTRVFDFYRDIRTYGRGQEEIYTQAAQNQVVFFRFEAGGEPQVLRNPASKGEPLLVKVKDVLTFGEELEIPVDLVVLAVGQEPNPISDLVEKLKIPVGARRSSCATCPPTNGLFSTRITGRPLSASSRAALRPATPPPITTACLCTATRMDSRGSSIPALAAAAATNRVALPVASSPWCTQLTCSLRLACSYT